MKKILFSLMLMIGFASQAQSFTDETWVEIPIVDEFGDETGEYVEAYVGTGIFSNTATTGSKLYVKLVYYPKEHGSQYNSYEQYVKYCEKISKDWKKSTRKFFLKPSRMMKRYQEELNEKGSFKLVLFEYGSSPTNLSYKYDYIYISAKDENGVVVKTYKRSNSYVEYNQEYLYIKGFENAPDYGGEFSDIFDLIMNSTGDVKISMSIGSSTYIFTVEGRGGVL